MKIALIVSLITNVCMFIAAFVSICQHEKKDELIADMKKQHKVDEMMRVSYKETNERLVNLVNKQQRTLDLQRVTISCLDWQLDRKQKKLDKLADAAKEEKQK